MSNLKQLGLGAMMYVQDYDDMYPTIYNANNPSADRLQFWTGMIQPYVKSVQLFYCPSSPINVKPTLSNTIYGQYAAARGTFKGINTSWPTARQRNALPMAAVETPSTIYMIMDGSYYEVSPQYIPTAASYHSYLPGMGDLGADCTKTDDSSDTGYRKDCDSGRHFSGVNVAFADGHVKWLKSEILIAEAKKCTTAPAYGDYCGGPGGQSSAWNPWVANS